MSSLRAFDADSGAELWSVPAPEGLPFDGCASFLSDGSVAFATGSWGDDANGGVVAVDAATGAARWRFDVPRSEPTRSTRGIWAKPLVFNDTTVVVGDFGGRLWALDAATGRARWSFQERRDATGLYGDEIWAPVAVTPRNEFVFTSNIGWIRKIYICNLEKCKISLTIFRSSYLTFDSITSSQAKSSYLTGRNIYIIRTW